jgi:hypothetical protein
VSGLADRVDGYGRVVGHDMRGAGMSIQLSKNGRFKIHYYAKMVSGVCRSEARMVEIGRYSYNGRYLTLTSQGHKGDICTCCRGNKRTKVNKRYRKRRKYEVFGVSGKPHAMVLRGTCAPYMVDTRCRSTNSVIKGGPPDIVGNFKFGRVVKK